MRNEILDYFRKADGNFVSGQQISKTCMSRVQQSGSILTS